MSDLAQALARIASLKADIDDLKTDKATLEGTLASQKNYHMQHVDMLIQAAHEQVC